MKFAISNIAWRADEDGRIADCLPRLGVQGVELAPTRLWPEPLKATGAQVSTQRRFWDARGLPIVALQSLLFGRADLVLFGTADARAQMLSYLGGMIGLTRDLGAQVLVFGAPRNRKAGARSPAEAQLIAVEFFRELGNRAAGAGVCFCIEPNPPYYDCDFVTTSAEGLALVDAVKTAGFGLHLATAGLALAGEDPDAALSAAEGRIRHFHVSEKDLAPIGTGTVEHARLGAALRRIQYPHWTSIAMRALPAGPRGTADNLPAIEKALDILQTLYGR